MATKEDCCVCLLPYEIDRGERKCDTCESYTCYHCLLEISKFDSSGEIPAKVYRFKGWCIRKKQVQCYLLRYKCPCCRSDNVFNLRHSSKYLRTWMKDQSKSHHVFPGVDDEMSLSCEIVKPFSDLIYSVQ